MKKKYFFAIPVWLFGLSGVMWQARAQPLTLDQVQSQLQKSAVRAQQMVYRLECPDVNDTRDVYTAIPIDDEGHLLTVGLESPDTEKVCARDSNGTLLEARWIAMDQVSGLTLLRLESGSRPGIELSEHSPVVGSLIMTVGNPYGMNHSVSIGSISGVDRTVRMATGTENGLIQFSAPVFPGDTGGLLADCHGRMIGMIFTGLSDPTDRSGKAVPGLGFAISYKRAREIAQLLKSGKGRRRGFLGVLARDMKTSGLEITGVLDSSPAQQAGIKVNDIVLSVGGKDVSGIDDLWDLLSGAAPGVQLDLNVLRSNENQIIRVVLGERKFKVTVPSQDIEDAVDQSVERVVKPSSRPNISQWIYPEAFPGVKDRRIRALENRIEELEKVMRALHSKLSHPSK